MSILHELVLDTSLSLDIAKNIAKGAPKTSSMGTVKNATKLYTIPADDNYYHRSNASVSRSLTSGGNVEFSHKRDYCTPLLLPPKVYGLYL